MDTLSGEAAVERFLHPFCYEVSSLLETIFFSFRRDPFSKEFGAQGSKQEVKKVGSLVTEGGNIY